MFECSEQLLFSCVSSKVSICNYVACHMLNAYVDPWDMLKFVHVNAQMSLFMGENDNVFFDSRTLACEWTNHRAGSQLKRLRRHHHHSRFPTHSFSYPPGSQWTDSRSHRHICRTSCQGSHPRIHGCFLNNPSYLPGSWSCRSDTFHIRPRRSHGAFPGIWQYNTI